MDAGEALTRWTVRAALLLYVAALLLRPARPMGARSLWTAGFGAFVLHMVAAFHVYHGWSHAAAHADTAAKTAALTGLDWGGGLYLNYLFAAVWAGDAAWWWLRPASYQARPFIVEAAVQGYLGFIAFNATVVFVAGPVRWLGAAATGLLLVVAAQSMRSRERSL